MNKIITITAIIMFQIFISGCYEVTQSSSMALDNANSVVRSTNGKVWNGPAETEQKKEEEKAAQDAKRY